MELKIPNISASMNGEVDLFEVMKSLEDNPIDRFSWGKVDPAPMVCFKIAHNNKTILLQYDIWETETLARYSNHNAQVCKDSCVEFFIAFEGEQNYYNFEFNCLGTCHAAWGSDRNNRQLLKSTIINQIQEHTKMQRAIKNGLPLINWQLSLQFPLNVFSFDDIDGLIGKKATANFYKCGDDLCQPHFITWNPVKAEKPDFHLKSHFGRIEFL
ncbi:carbohydrate-binding family 9-like protein [Labilibaculum sp. K2S]|uniref:carbohydrate-binding family 9-like protein n=1 Tax=Labilibaculum sp. K2S TaxID=3056386 RepID=UPI0025A42CAD|nr:carbohydrate-binding family 9-like protein [Labilibaculum sp. K2S]MDM8161498.1 carbohydrate-binding family 9-like protein [Labilibaculum sp. K2S]